LVAVLGALLALGVPSPSRAVTGEQDVLVVLATWGPTPFVVGDVRREVFDEAAAFLRRSSYGKVTLRGEVTPWLRVLPPSPACSDEWWEQGIPRAVSGPARAGAAARGYRLGTFDRVIYVVPSSRCAFLGLGWGAEALLNGSIDAELVVHELGHTWGLGHAGAATCADDTCALEEDGDVYSPMGMGFDDFSVIEKVRLGWTSSVAVMRRPGTFRIGRAGGVGRRALALRIDTALGAYWLEYRPRRVDLGRDGVLPGGVVTRYVPEARTNDPLGTTSVLIQRPARRPRPVVTVGETIRVPGVFTARFRARNGSDDATLDVRWADRVEPQAPHVLQPTAFRATGPTVRVRWEAPFERGSGVASYRVSLDGGKAQVVRERELLLRDVAAGVHFVSISAVDRAGNRGLASVQRFEVQR